MITRRPERFGRRRTSVRHDACHGCATAAFSRAVSDTQPSCDQTIFRRGDQHQPGLVLHAVPVRYPARLVQADREVKAGQLGRDAPGPPAPMAVTVSSTAVRAGTRRYRSSGSGVVDDSVQRVCRTLGAEDPGGGDRPDAHHGHGTCTRSWAATPCTTTSLARAGPEPAAAEQRRKRSGAITDLTTAKIRRRSVLGGLINEWGRRHEDHQ